MGSSDAYGVGESERIARAGSNRKRAARERAWLSRGAFCRSVNVFADGLARAGAPFSHVPARSGVGVWMIRLLVLGGDG